MRIAAPASPLNNSTPPSLRLAATNWRHMPPAAAAVALALFSLLVPGPAPAAPEYIVSESPIVSTLDEVPSATERFGILPANRPLDGMHLRSRMLPEWRERVPKAGEPFFDDTILFVRPRAYYRLRDNGDGTKSEAAAFGGAVGFETGYWRDALRIGVTGYTSQEIYGPETRPGSGLLSPSQDSYTVLGEAYADIMLHRDTLSNVTLYRQRLDLPYINANDSRMTPNTFEAYTFISNPVPELRWGFGHVDRIKFRNSVDFESMSASAGAPGTDEGVTVAGLRYDFSENFHASIIEEYGWDTINTLYVETERLLPISDDLSFKLGTQFTDQRSVGNEFLGSFDAQHLGVKGSLGYGPLIASLGFTWTSDGAAIMKPWGGSPSYNSVMISDFDRAGEKSVRASLSCDFTQFGLEGVATSASWVSGNTPDSGAAASPDQQEFNINLDYRPPIETLDNLWLRFRYASNDLGATAGQSRSDFRVIINYSLSF